MEIISRKDAKALGLKRYYTRKACAKSGHDSERYVLSKSCVLCVSALTKEQKDKKNKYNKEYWSIFKKRNPHYDAQRIALSKNRNPEKKKEINRNYYEKNRDIIRLKHREYYQKNKEKAKERTRARRKILKLVKQDKQPT